ncbi:hypothetical protein [Nocardia anaemiae]|uniref:hypothetical protein n=1 Tax=Nocardia anaemiae TaxID=263910 RepID=UPI0007A4E3AC|nr:hypothetical protein [Nocardia anaemiae]
MDLSERQRDNQLKLRKTGRIAIAGLAAVAALSLSACGSDDSKTATTPTKTSTSVTKLNASVPPTPSVADLNAQLLRALDPSVPNSEKLDLVQGATADPELPNRLAQAYQQAGAKAEVTDVSVFGDALNAKAKFTINGQENIVDVPFVAEGGKWKVEKNWACTMLTNLGQQSTACG